MSCGVGLRCSSDPALLWLWHRPVAAAPITPLPWEPPYAPGVTQETAKRQKTKQNKKKRAGILQERFAAKDLTILFFILFSHCTAKGSSYPYMYTLQLHFSPTLCSVAT